MLWQLLFYWAVWCNGADEVGRSWRDLPEREEPRGAASRSQRAGDGVHYDRGDFAGGRRKRYDRYADDDDEDGNNKLLCACRNMQ